MPDRKKDCERGIAPLEEVIQLIRLPIESGDATAGEMAALTVIVARAQGGGLMLRVIMAIFAALANQQFAASGVLFYVDEKGRLNVESPQSIEDEKEIEALLKS